MSRRDQDDRDEDDVHREMLQHLDRNPPPKPRREAAPKQPAPKPADPPKPPADPPRLMLRKMRLEPALQRLEAFLRAERHRGTPKVIVVVGKGLRSGSEGPVIGPAVRQWCDRHPGLVHDVHVAPPSQGGDGALVLHLTTSV